MLGVLVNTATVISGSLIGLIFKKGIPQKYTKAIMTGIGLCTVAIGILGLSDGTNILVLIFSIILGAFLGTLLDIDKGIENLGKFVDNKFKSKNRSASVAEGFVTASLLFCVGSMTIVGSLKSGISGDNTMIFTKSLLDFISSIMLSVSLGIGVLVSGLFVFAFQGALVLFSGILAPFLTDVAIAEISCVGSLMILALGFNLLGITKIKVANYLPAIIIAPIIVYIINLF